LPAPELKAIEDRAVLEAVRMQEEVGLRIVSDGEMRRVSFQSQMTEAVEGFSPHDLDAYLWGEWSGNAEVGDLRVERPAGLGVVAPLRRKRHLTAEEFTFLRAITHRVPKVSLPSPSLWINFWTPGVSTAAYPDLDAFLADVTRILRGEVEELVRLGATYIQLDAPHYTALLEPRTRAFYEQHGWSLDRWLSHAIELDNAVMAGFQQVTFSIHFCRGNQGSRWLVSGGYDLLVEPVLGRTRAQRLLLEFDDERSGSFEPLARIPEDKTVVLGLVTTKSGRLESKKLLKDRIRQATRFVPLERLALSTQCGFASSVIGNRLPEESQRLKLALVAAVAEEVWG
jgi:5-methyltetrahydropteroyltriglutamate--homocysteine methyltransferase